MTIDDFFGQFKPSLYRRKERLTFPGDELTSVYYLGQGYVRENVVSKNGNEFTSYVFAPNTFFPLIWHKDEFLGEHYYESLTPVEARKAPKEKLLNFLAEHPKANSFLAEQLTSYSASLLKRLESRVFDNAARVVVLTLIDLARLFGKKQSREIIISYWFTHQDIAAISGLSRESVTNQVDNLVKKKLIKYREHFIVISDLEAFKMAYL